MVEHEGSVNRLLKATASNQRPMSLAFEVCVCVCVGVCVCGCVYGVTLIDTMR